MLSQHAAITRRAQFLRLPLRRRGIILALVGPDGAGKTTLAQALAVDDRVRARLIYMGSNVYSSTISLPTSRWIYEKKKSFSGGGNGPRRKLLNALAFGDQLICYYLRCAAARYHRLRGRVVILDRYVYDSWIAKAGSTVGKRLRKRLLEGGSPTPDLVVLLDAPGSLLLERKGEHTAQWLETQRLAYLELKHRLPQMVVIDATQTLEEVRREVTSLVLKQHVYQMNTEIGWE